MAEKVVSAVVTPQMLRGVPDILPRIGEMMRGALVKAGAVCELESMDLTDWRLEFEPERFEPGSGVIPEHFAIACIAPMPDAIEVSV